MRSYLFWEKSAISRVSGLFSGRTDRQRQQSIRLVKQPFIRQPKRLHIIPRVFLSVCQYMRAFLHHRHHFSSQYFALTPCMFSSEWVIIYPSGFYYYYVFIYLSFIFSRPIFVFRSRSPSLSPFGFAVIVVIFVTWDDMGYSYSVVSWQFPCNLNHGAAIICVCL